MPTHRGIVQSYAVQAWEQTFAGPPHWSKENNVIYEENGVTIRSIPAIHLEGSVSFILEWKGMKIAFSGDTLANRWWVEHAKGAGV